MLGYSHENIERSEAGLVSPLNNDLNFETDVVMFATGHEPCVEGRRVGSDAVQRMAQRPVAPGV